MTTTLNLCQPVTDDGDLDAVQGGIGPVAAGLLLGGTAGVGLVLLSVGAYLIYKYA